MRGSATRSWGLLLAGCLAIVFAAELAMLFVSTGYFRGGFNSVTVGGPGTLAGLVVGAALLDGTVVLALWLAALPVLARVGRSRFEVFCLAADQPRGAHGFGKQRAQHPRQRRLVSARDLAIGEVEQPEGREDRRCLAELDVIGRPSSSERRIIHAGQIVEDERCGVHEFHRRGCRQCPDGVAEQPAALVLLEQRVDGPEPGGRAERHPDRHRPVELHHRARRDLGEGVVQRRDPWPVRLVGPPRPRVAGGDRGLHGVRAQRCA